MFQIDLNTRWGSRFWCMPQSDSISNLARPNNPTFNKHCQVLVLHPSLPNQTTYICPKRMMIREKSKLTHHPT